MRSVGLGCHFGAGKPSRYFSSLAKLLAIGFILRFHRYLAGLLRLAWDISDFLYCSSQLHSVKKVGSRSTEIGRCGGGEAAEVKTHLPGKNGEPLYFVGS